MCQVPPPPPTGLPKKATLRRFPGNGNRNVPAAGHMRALIGALKSSGLPLAAQTRCTACTTAAAAAAVMLSVPGRLLRLLLRALAAFWSSLAPSCLRLPSLGGPGPRPGCAPASAAARLPRGPVPLSVNYHFTRQCNYKCGFCFHTAKTSFVLPLQEAQRGLRLLKEAGE